MNRDMRIHVLEQLTKEYYGIFGSPLTAFIAEFLSLSEENLQKFCRKHPEIDCDAQSILLSLGAAMYEGLTNLYSWTFLKLLHQVRDSLVGQTPEERYDDFVNNCLNRDWQQLQETGTLGRLVKERIRRTGNAIQEFFSRLDRDMGVVESILGEPIRTLEQLKISAGDTHNGGRTVILLSVNQTEKIVYKPHCCSTDRILAELYRWLNQHERVRVKLKHMDFLDAGDYGWQQYIPHKPCENRKEAEDFMYRLGCLLFVTYLTNSNDLHMENLIACGAYPMLVDTETLAFNIMPFGGATKENQTSWNQMLAASVFSSILLPTDLLPGPKNIQEDSSGILGGANGPVQSEIMVPRLVELGTDNIHYELQKAVTQPDANGNLAILDGNLLHAGDYMEWVVEGFRDAYQSAMEDQTGLQALLSEDLWKEGKFRQVLRNTDLYMQFLQASYQPQYMENRSVVFECLKGKSGYINESNRRMVQEEIAQLSEDDIPYFYAKYNDTTLYTCEHGTVQDFYGSSIEAQMRRKALELREADLYRQIFFVRNAIASSRLDESQNMYCPLPAECFEPETKAEQIRRICSWVVRFREKYHRIPSKYDREALYFCTFPGDESGRRKLGVEPPVLYSGIGSAVFCQSLADWDRQYQAMTDEALRTLNDYSSPIYENKPMERYYPGIGVFDGLGSQLYWALYLYARTKEPETLTRIQSVCDKLLQKAEAGVAQYDVMSGCAGLVILALQARKKLPEENRLLELARSCGKHLYEAFQNQRLPEQTGFAHGLAGFGTALVMIGTVEAREAYYQAGMELIARENEAWSESPAGWHSLGERRGVMNAWCYGAPGIVAARQYAYSYARTAEQALLKRDIDRAVAICVEEVLHGDDRPILCHGLPGNIEILRWYARRTGTRSLEPVIEAGVNRLLRHLKEYGYLYMHTSKTMDVSFMNGLTGMGYMLLKTVHPELPCILALETGMETEL